MVFKKSSSNNNTELLDTNEKYKLALVEMRGYFDYLAKANEELDKKIFSLFSSITIILAIFGLFGFDVSNDILCVVKILLVLLALTFLYFCGWTIYGYFPRSAPFPYDGTYEGARKVFIDKLLLSDSYEQIIVNYEENMKFIQGINRKKKLALIHIIGSYFVSIILTIAIVLII